MNHRIEITVTTTQLLPGYDNDAELGPLEGKIAAGVESSAYDQSKVSHWNRTNQEAIQLLGNNRVSIVDLETYAVLWQKPVSQVNSANIRAALDWLAGLEFNPGSGQYTGPDGGTVDPVIPGDDPGSDSLFPGLGLFNLELPRLAWFVLAAGSGYKATQSRGTVGKVGWGFAATALLKKGLKA